MAARGARGTVDEAAVARVLHASVLHAATARSRSTATPSANGWPRRGRLAAQEHRGWRRDAHRDHRGGGRARESGMLPRPPASWIVGRRRHRNPTLMRMLAERLAPAERRDRGRSRLVGGCARGAGLRLSRRCAALRGLPLTFPTTTGAPRADDRRRAGEMTGRRTVYSRAGFALGLRAACRDRR